MTFIILVRLKLLIAEAPLHLKRVVILHFADIILKPACCGKLIVISDILNKQLVFKTFEVNQRGEIQ